MIIGIYIVSTYRYILTSETYHTFFFIINIFVVAIYKQDKPQTVPNVGHI